LTTSPQIDVATLSHIESTQMEKQMTLAEISSAAEKSPLACSAFENTVSLSAQSLTTHKLCDPEKANVVLSEQNNVNHGETQSSRPVTLEEKLALTSEFTVKVRR